MIKDDAFIFEAESRTVGKVKDSSALRVRQGITRIEP
jgi:hypothetical protein